MSVSSFTLALFRAVLSGFLIGIKPIIVQAIAEFGESLFATTTAQRYHVSPIRIGNSNAVCLRDHSQQSQICFPLSEIIYIGIGVSLPHHLGPVGVIPDRNADVELRLPFYKAPIGIVNL